MKKKSFSVLKVLGPQQCKTCYVFMQVSHSNKEESTSLQRKALKSPWLASIQGADASSALETENSSQ